MDWTRALFDTIDIRSFSNVWYWIAIVVLWSSLSHWVLGVPFDLIMRAKRKKGEIEQDLIDIVRVNVNRLLDIGRGSGTWLIGFVCCFVSSLGLMAIYYQIEMAQALLLMVVPVCCVGALSLRTARKIEQEAHDVEAMYKLLGAHRLWTQVIGMISIFVTALFGMYHNVRVPDF